MQRTRTFPARFVAAALCLLGVATGSAGAARPSSAMKVDGALDSLVEQSMREAGIVGVGAAIIVDRQLVWSKGYGFADKASARPFTPDTMMNIGSISKTFTGVAMMRAVDDGLLSLDADISTYLPFALRNPHRPDAPITLRHLATHTSGITDRPAVYGGSLHFGGDSPETLGAFLADYFKPGGKHYSADNFLAVAPGSHREYSNIGASLAGYIVEIAVGERLDAYTRRQIFEPLAMQNSGWFLSAIDPAKHTTLYASQGGPSMPMPLYGLTTYPDGGVRTSVADLARFFIALLNDGEYAGARILSTASAAEMLRFQYTDAKKPENVRVRGEDSVNSGLFWATKYDTTRIGHNGSDPGIRTMMLADPSRRIGVILFSNTSLCGEGEGKLAAIFEALWTQASAWQGEAQTGGEN